MSLPSTFKSSSSGCISGFLNIIVGDELVKTVHTQDTLAQVLQTQGFWEDVKLRQAQKDLTQQEEGWRKWQVQKWQHSDDLEYVHKLPHVAHGSPKEKTDDEIHANRPSDHLFGVLG